jgi:hypothetical protein
MYIPVYKRLKIKERGKRNFSDMYVLNFFHQHTLFGEIKSRADSTYVPSSSAFLTWWVVSPSGGCKTGTITQ